LKTASKKAKGSRLEKWVKKFFEDFGFQSRRQPGSGIYSDFPHDNCIELPGVGRVILECKSWKHGWRTGDKAMGEADMLVIKRDFGEPCFYIPERTMVAICKSLQGLEELKTSEGWQELGIKEGWISRGHRVDPNTFQDISRPLPAAKQIKKKGFV
jgi:hypothetical protein